MVASHSAINWTPFTIHFVPKNPDFLSYTCHSEQMFLPCFFLSSLSLIGHCLPRRYGSARREVEKGRMRERKGHVLSGVSFPTQCGALYFFHCVGSFQRLSPLSLSPHPVSFSEPYTFPSVRPTSFSVCEPSACHHTVFCIAMALDGCVSFLRVRILPFPFRLHTPLILSYRSPPQTHCKIFTPCI